MFDGSKLEDATNRTVTRTAVERCQKFGVSVEAELGEIGGKDGVHALGVRTDPKDAAALGTDTGVDALGRGGGPSCHDQSDGHPPARAHRSVRATVAVLHGSSGVPGDLLVDAIRARMGKVKIATHLNTMFTAAVRDRLAADPDLVDTRRYLGAGRAAVPVETARLLTILALR